VEGFGFLIDGEFFEIEYCCFSDLRMDKSCNTMAESRPPTKPHTHRRSVRSSVSEVSVWS
jgi:hypothetical protein